MNSHETIIAETRAWVDRAVIGLNLCPFAKAVQVKNQVRYVVSDASSVQELLEALSHEIRLLTSADPAELETTLLIHPLVLADFLDFNDFLELAENTVRDLGYEGIIQLASFHPQYQFAGTEADDVSNATNRSPYPTLHLLREESIARAVATFPNTDTIFENNIHTMKELGAEGWKNLRTQCRKDSAEKSSGNQDAGGKKD